MSRGPVDGHLLKKNNIVLFFSCFLIICSFVAYFGCTLFKSWLKAYIIDYMLADSVSWDLLDLVTWHAEIRLENPTFLPFRLVDEVEKLSKRDYSVNNQGIHEGNWFSQAGKGF